jgi:hypothetical protein
MSYTYDEAYSIYNENIYIYIYKAKKLHTCDACRITILPGHYYANVFIVFQNKSKTVKRCGSCQTTHLHLRKLCANNDMWPNEKLNCGTSYENEWGEEPPDEISDLPFLSPEERSQLLTT